MKLKKGKILKVRRGYNANSSSISTVVTYFLWGSAAVVTVVNTISAAVFAGDERDEGIGEDQKEGGRKEKITGIDNKDRNGEITGIDGDDQEDE